MGVSVCGTTETGEASEDTMSGFDNHIENYRRVRYVGDHPWIKDKVGDAYFDETHGCDLFRPDIDGDGYSHWYRVNHENLIWL